MKLLCRVYLLCKKLRIPKALQRVPALKRPVTRVLRQLLPNESVWVQVQSGICEGLWMRLNLRKEVRLWLGQHEPTVQAALILMIQPGMVLYDIGAHVGSIALGVARALGPSGRVVAFEADPNNAENLTENRDRNGLQGSLHIVASAAWSHSSDAICFRRGGEKRSHGGVETSGQHPALGSGELIKVPAITLDDFIENGGPIPRLVKIDVEGGEYDVLRGAEYLFSHHRPLLVAEVHHKDAEDQIRVWLDNLGYSSRWIAPPERYPCCVFAWAAESLKATKWMGKSDDSCS
jgi:FkbM family methyltransferase